MGGRILRPWAVATPSGRLSEIYMASNAGSSLRYREKI